MENKNKGKSRFSLQIAELNLNRELFVVQKFSYGRDFLW